MGLPRVSDLLKVGEPAEESTKYPRIFSGEVGNAHDALVDPTPVLSQQLIVYSSEVAELIGLDPNECETRDFWDTFSGNSLPGKMRGWPTI